MYFCISWNNLLINYIDYLKSNKEPLLCIYCLFSGGTVKLYILKKCQTWTWEFKLKAQHNKRCDITSAVHGKKPGTEGARFVGQSMHWLSHWNKPQQKKSYWSYMDFRRNHMGCLMSTGNNVTLLVEALKHRTTLSTRWHYSSREERS